MCCQKHKMKRKAGRGWLAAAARATATLLSTENKTRKTERPFPKREVARIASSPLVSSLGVVSAQYYSLQFYFVTRTDC